MRRLVQVAADAVAAPFANHAAAVGFGVALDHGSDVGEMPPGLSGLDPLRQTVLRDGQQVLRLW